LLRVINCLSVCVVFGRVLRLPALSSFPTRRSSDLEDFDLRKLQDYIDWMPFFRSWGLFGRFPEILNDEVVGPQARELFADGQKMLQRIFDEKLLTARAVFGIFPANTVDEDDIEIYDDEGNVITTVLTLRQQVKKRAGIPNIALADFIAPKETRLR